jgi:hypothetical protein
MRQASLPLLAILSPEQRDVVTEDPGAAAARDGGA